MSTYMYTEFGPDRVRFAGPIPERLIFRPKMSIQYKLSAYNKMLTKSIKYAMSKMYANKLKIMSL